MKLSWNFYSGIVAPVMTITAIIILILFVEKQSTSSFYYLPFALLGTLMMGVLSFWSAYLFYIRKKVSKDFLIKLAKTIIIIGYMCFAILIMASLLKLSTYIFSLHIFDFKTDKMYWIISIWTLIEIVHHCFYKLVYDKKMSLLEILDKEEYENLTLPVGGAIGIAIKRLTGQIAAG